MDYWEKALIDNDCTYHIMKATSKKEQFFEAQDIINKVFLDGVKPLSDFIRN